MCQYIELKVDPGPLYASCQIPTINKKVISKKPIKTRITFKWLFMYIIPSTSSKSLTKDTNFYNYLLIEDAYSRSPRLYGMENITIEEIMDKIYMFQAIFGKVDEFGGGIWRELKLTLERSLPPRSFRKVFMYVG